MCISNTLREIAGQQQQHSMIASDYYDGNNGAIYLPGIDLHEWPFKSLISFLQQIANLAYRNIELVGDQRTKFKLNGFGEILSDVRPSIGRHFKAPLSSLYIHSFVRYSILFNYIRRRAMLLMRTPWR